MKAKDKDALPDLTRYEQDGIDMNPGQHGDWYRISDVNAALASRHNEVDERAAFEAWARQQPSLDLSLLPESAKGMGFYLSGHTQWIYDGWMARALASRPAEVDEEGLPPLPPEVARAMKGEVAFFVKWQEAGQELRGSLMLYTAEQFRQGQRDAVAADRARREKLPANADEMVAFIGSHYNSMRDGKPDPNDIVYELTVHDLLSAFRWWFDDFELEDEPTHTTNKENGGPDGSVLER